MYGYAPQAVYAPQAACAPQMCASQMHGAHVYAPQTCAPRVMYATPQMCGAQAFISSTQPRYIVQEACAQQVTTQQLMCAQMLPAQEASGVRIEEITCSSSPSLALARPCVKCENPSAHRAHTCGKRKAKRPALAQLALNNPGRKFARIMPATCSACDEKDQVIAQLRRTVVEQGDNIKRLNEELAASRDGCTTSDDDEEEEEEEEELGGLAEEVGGSGGSAEEEEEEEEEVEEEEQLGLSAIEWYMLCMTYLPGMAPRRYEAASGVRPTLSFCRIPQLPRGATVYRRPQMAEEGTPANAEAV